MAEMTYDTWREDALARDAASGANRWKAEDESGLFDYRVIRARLDELVAVRRTGNVRRLLYYLNEGLHGNMGGMGSPKLYEHAAFGTKNLVSDYIRELTGGLEQLASAADMGPEDKLEFFRRGAQAFGACALMLSGAGSLAPFHLGVAKALLAEDLLPDIISGASAGGIVAAMLGTHDDTTLAARLGHERLAGDFRTLAPDDDGAGHRRWVDRDHLAAIIEVLIPDVTFAEALAASGRHLSISVAPSEVHQQSRTLNAITAPNVFIREAVMATCAIPGLFPAVTLAAKGYDGRRLPFVRSRKWVDGSVTDDMPVGRLSRVYGCNFFITSQTNPIVRWALTDPHATDPFSQFASIYQASLKQWWRASYPFAMHAVRDVYPLNVVTRMCFDVLTQDYTADVNIMPRQRFYHPMGLLAVLSAQEAGKLVREGEQATWPKIERIRNCTMVGRTIGRIRDRLESVGH